MATYLQSTDDHWPILKKAIINIQEKKNCQLTFEELYRNVYSMVRNNQGEKLYIGIKKTVTIYLINKVRKKLFSSFHNNFLQTLNKAWNDHQAVMHMICNIFLYLNRTYVIENKLDNIYSLGLILFLENIIKSKSISYQIRHTLLQMIDAERRGETGNSTTIRNTCYMLIILGIDSNIVYEDEFEKYFLKETRDFYKKQSYLLLSENNLPTYIHKVNKIINDEIRRAKIYFCKNTEECIMELIKEELIRKHLKTNIENENSGIIYMLKNEKLEDLSQMYRLFNVADDCLKIIVKHISLYFKTEVKSLNDEKELNYREYIMGILNLKEKYDRFLKECFNSLSYLSNALIGDLKYVLTLNPKCPEYIALFLDDIIKNKYKKINDEENEEIITKILILCRYLKNKDIFLQYYEHLLMHRFLDGKNNFIETELDMISRLRIEYGVHMILNLKQMIKDIIYSNNLTEIFKHQYRELNLGSVDLRMKVLTMAFWPIKAITTECNIPKILKKFLHEFIKQYLKNHSKHRFILQPQLGWAELEVIFYENCSEGKIENGNLMIPNNTLSINRYQSRRYTLYVSTYQMCILMLFNSKKVITFKDISSETNIRDKDLKKELTILTSQKLLLKNPESISIRSGHIFTINKFFSSKTNYIYVKNINEKYKTEYFAEITDNANKNRKYEIENIILRIMKHSKTMQRNLLISRVIRQLKTKFETNVSLIKTQIENLVERNYISKRNEDQSIYQYIE